MASRNINPQPAGIKISLLSKGINFDENLFKKFSSEFYENQYVYDKTSKKITEEHRIPQVLLLGDGVICSVLRREKSPWSLKPKNGMLALYYMNDFVRNIDLPQKPTYFGKKLQGGLLSERVIAVAGADTPGFFFYPDCYYFDLGLPCSFCSLKKTRNTVGKQHLNSFTPELISEATELFQQSGWHNPRVVFITTGTLSSDEHVSYVTNLIRACHDALSPKIRIHLLVSPPNDLSVIRRYKEAGVSTIAFNLEIFDKKNFEKFCPGKNKLYGYEKTIEALLVAKKVFGEYNAFCGFVWGLEPVESTLNGYEYMLKRRVSISSNVFHADEGAVLSNKKHPSETEIKKLCIGQAKLLQKYPNAKPLFDVSMRSTMDNEIYRGLIC